MSSLPTVDAVIFLPFTDGEFEMLLDTLSSIDHYVGESHRIIAVDDCSDGFLNERLAADRPDITVLRNATKNGGRSGLYATMARAVKHALKHLRFKVFLKMDTDALMVGSGLVGEAIRYFCEHPHTGILGSYRVRADGHRRRWNKWKMAFYYEMSPLMSLTGRPRLWRSLVREASRHGYAVGENVLGGAYLLSEPCLKSMHAQGCLDYRPEDVTAYSRIGDEIVFSLLAKASGYHLGDFGTPDHSVAVALDVLPLSKEEIVHKGKTVIHSVKRGLNGESQEELRSYFRTRRQGTRPLGEA